MCVNVGTCVCMRVHVCACGFMCMHVVCGYMCTSVYMGTCGGTHVYMWGYICVYVYICVSMWCLYACILVYTHHLTELGAGESLFNIIHGCYIDCHLLPFLDTFYGD